MKDCKSITFSAPGKLIISGEYSVLEGYSAIAIAIKKRLVMKLEKTNNNKITIVSDKFHEKEINFDNDNDFTAMTFKYFNINSGVNINITSELDTTLGLGSSGAYHVCLLSCVMYFTKKISDISNISKDKIYRIWMEINRKNNYIFGSGVDVITSLFGGIMYFNFTKYEKIETKFFEKCDIYAIYAGYKTKSIDAIKKIRNIWQNNKLEYQKIMQEISQITENIYNGLKNNDEKLFKQNIIQNQILLEKLGICDENMKNIIQDIQKHQEYGKISGSGFGDCIMYFGDTKLDNAFKIEIENTGLRLDS